MSVTFYNDLEFKAEDAIAALLVPVAANLAGALVVKSLITDSLATSHVAIIADDFEPSQNPPRTGNHKGVVRIKIVTSFDEALAAGFADLRSMHRQRCGVVRDALMVATLDTDLTTAGQAIVGQTGFTVQGFNYGRISQRIEGRSWVTEWSVILDSVCGSNL